MAWRVLKVARLPLGCRVLRTGCVGDDVGELQKMLAQAGFYFGQVDGCYGVLTESAVALAERTFGLRIDGIAGKQVVKMLRGLSKKMGRTVYTVKAHENLEQISQKFGVAPRAWETIAGQGNPLKRIFPGMRLILNEKAVLFWEDGLAGKMPVTGKLMSGGTINRQGGLEISREADPDCFLIISADLEIWEEVITSRTKRRRLLGELQSLRYRKIGLDFRNMNPELSGYWKTLVKTVGCQKRHNGIFFVVAPVILTSKDLWRSHRLLQWLASCDGVDWLMVEAQLEPGTGCNFEEHMLEYYKKLAELNRFTMQKILPVIDADPWQTDMRKKVSYKEARMLRALNYRTSRYLPEIKLTKVNYWHKGEEQQLYYRDYQGWVDLFSYIKKYLFPGLVIRNQEMPGISLPDLIAGAFTVLPERKFLEMGKREYIN